MTSASLKTLLKQTKKQVQSGDGAGKVALALATMTSLSADAAEGVLDLPFSSRQIGLGDKAGLKRFKKSLASHLPEASAAIAKIPEHSELTPRDIAGLATRLMRTAVKAEPLRSVPAIQVKPQSAEARSRFADLLGKEFAEKASDRMVQAVGFRLHLGVREAVSAVLQSMVFEFEAPDAKMAGGTARESSGRESMAGSRSLQIQAVCDAFYRRSGAIRAEIERLAGPPSAGFRESVADLGSAVDVCWLNGTMRTLTTLRSIADIVADRAILRVGIPKALERELDRSAKTINTAAFRSANHLTGAGVRVAVIDGEVFANHSSLTGRLEIGHFKG